MVGIGSNVVMRIYTDGEPQLLYITLNSGKIKCLPLQIEELGSQELNFNDLTKISNSNEFCGTVHVKYYNKQFYTYALIWDNLGELLATYRLTDSSDFNLYSVAMHKEGEGQYSINGTYGNFTVPAGLEGGGIGIYYAQIMNHEVKLFEEIPFESLDNLVNSLSKRSKARLEKYDLSLSFHMHETENLQDGYLLIGETFEKTYRAALPSDPTFNLGMSSGFGAGSVFDGYQFKDAVLIKINLTGEVVWDQLVKMYPIHRPMKLKDMTTLNRNGEEFTLTAMKHKSVKLVRINKSNGTILKESRIDSFDTTTKSDIKLVISDMVYWYDNHYVAYGIEKIKRKGRKSKVFRIQKLMIL